MRKSIINKKTSAFLTRRNLFLKLLIDRAKTGLTILDFQMLVVRLVLAALSYPQANPLWV